VANGSAALPNTDGRGVVVRRFKEISAAIIGADQGGEDALTEVRLQLIRRFAAAACLAEQMEARLANGEVIDIAEHAQLCSTLVRLSQRIGLDRVPKDVSPSLAEYLAETESEVTDVVG
jgi:hypothetical protein